MNLSKFASTIGRGAVAWLLLLSALPAAAGEPTAPIVTSGRWEDSFDDAVGLEELNETRISNGAVGLNGSVRQVWEISSQVSFQAGTLNQVDAVAVPGTVQLAPAELSFNPNQLVSGSPAPISLLAYYTPPALASDGNQTLHLAWPDRDQDDIFYRCSANAGQSWAGTELLTNDGNTTIQDAPNLAVDSTGRVYAVWYDERLDPNGDIYLASRPGCGGSWSAGTPVAVAASLGPAQDDPALAIAGNNSLYLTWVADGAIYFSRSDTGGQSWSAAQKLNDASGAVASSPVLVVEPMGQKVWVAWAYDPAGSESNIYLATSLNGGQTWSPNLPIAPNPTQWQDAPAIARSPGGGLYLAWTGGGIYLSRSLDSGQNWGPAVPVHDEQFGRVWNGASLVVDDRETIYLTWHDRRNDIMGISPYYDIFMAYSQNGGQSWSANIRLNDDPVVNVYPNDPIDHALPAVAVNQAGQFFAAWWDERGSCTQNGGSTFCTYPEKKEIYFVSTPGFTFAANGTFTSAVHAAGGRATWDTIEWTATTPANTALTLHTRSGDTPVPDGTWSGWTPAYSASGQPIASPPARYIQVRANLTTTNPLATPSLSDVTLRYRPFVWKQTSQADFAGSVTLQNVDVTTLPGSVQLLPDVAFAPEQRVNDQLDTITETIEAPALTVVGSSIYLAWQDARNDNAGDIFFARSINDGQTWGPNIQINAGPPGVEQSAPYLAAQGANVYLVWHDEREGSEGDVYFARSTNGGQSWGSNVRVNDNAIAVTGDPAIATGADTRLHVTWATSKTLIYANHSTDAGQSWGGNVAVGGVNFGASSFTGYLAPGIATNGSGEVYVAWLDARDAFSDFSCYCLRDMDVYASRSVDNGSSWSAGVQITGPDGVAGQSRPYLAYHNNLLFTVWTDFRDTNTGDDQDPAIYFARSATGGQSWNPANVQLDANEPTAFVFSPVIAVDGGGTLYASWSSDYFDSEHDVFFTRSRDAGNTWQVERRVNNDAPGAAQGPPALVATTPGRVYLAWKDERAGSQDLYFTTSLTGTTYTSGTLISSVLDTEGAAQWGNIAWTATTPPGTTLSLYTRSGHTTNPDDGTWSPWSSGYTTSPTPVSSPSARYLQYRLDLATTNPYTTPVLHDISLEYGRYPLQGSAVSLPISPLPGFGEWQTVTFDATRLPGTTLTVDVLDSTGNVLLADVSSGASLTSYSPAQYPSLRLRANLTTSDPTVTPALNHWTLTWRPPPTEQHVQVSHANGGAAGGTDIYLNGSFLGRTDHLGLLNLPGPPQMGDRLSALYPLTETLTQRSAHNGWAYRTYLTNITLDGSGIPQTFTVSQAGAQHLTVRPENTLVLFNLVVSIEWDADTPYIDQIERAVRSASDYLYDYTDGQMAFGQVAIYDDGQNWADADIQISTQNIVRPHAYIGGLISNDKSHVIRIGRFWDGNSGNQGAWDQPEGYRTLAHEFGHYALHLYDEYFAYTFGSNGNLSGEVPAICTGPENRSPASDATNASVMDYQYTSTELSARNIPGLWSALCEQTAQWQLNHESPWETLIRKYADTANPPRWQLSSPLSRGSVMAGPANLPDTILALPTVTKNNEGTSGASRLLTVYGPTGQGYGGAIVALYKQSGRVIGQGFTNSNGRLEIYGAEAGDIVRVASFDGGIAGSVTVGAETNLSVTLAAVGGLAAQATGAIPHMQVRANPGSAPNQVDLFVALYNFGPNADPSVIVTEPGSETGYAPTLAYSPATGAYEAQISFSATEKGMGRIRAVGAVGGSLVRLQSTYRLQWVSHDQGGEIFSNDGNLSLYLKPDSLPGSEAYFVVMPPGAIPGPPPTGLTLVGDPYDLTASGALAALSQPGVLSLRYDGALVNSDSPPAGLGIYRWEPNSHSWQAAPGDLDEAHKAMVAPVTTLGVYALLAPPGSWQEGSNSVFLPFILKQK